MSSSYETRKSLKFVITLGAGNFGAQGNVMILTGLRASVEIQKAGGQMMSTATVRIYGVPLEDMNQLSTLAFLPLSYVRNTIKVYAVEGQAETLVFDGEIIKSYPDFQSIPDVCLYMETQIGVSAQLKPALPQSYPGSPSISSIFKSLADSIGVDFKDNGVTGTLDNPYFPGSLIDQLRQLSAASGVPFFLDNGQLSISQPGIALVSGGVVPIIDKTTGLVGYPTFDKVGVQFVTLFNPAIRFGGQIDMRSGIRQADGLWQVCSITYRLESEKPGGAWFQMIQCTGSGLVPIK